MTDQKPESKEEDKSIDTLLQEYAGDVKERDLDAFLNEETDTDFAVDDDDQQTAPAQKKSSGMVSLFVSVLLIGAGTAAAVVYMNQNNGMQSVLGTLPFMSSNPEDTANTAMQNTMGFEPSQPANDTGAPVVMDAPVADMQAVPAPTDPTATVDTPAPALSDIAGAPVEQPAPIENQIDASAMPASEDADLEVAVQTLDAPVPTPKIEASAPTAPVMATPEPIAPSEAVVAEPTAPSTPAVSAEAAPVDQANSPATPDVGNAVDTWAASTADNLNNAQLDKPEVATTTKAPAAPEAPSLTTIEVPDVAAIPTPKKERAVTPARPRDPSDAALLPPYLAIQARKAAGGEITTPVSETKRQAPMMTGEAPAAAPTPQPAIATGPVLTANAATVATSTAPSSPVSATEPQKPRISNTPLALDTRRSLPEVADVAPAMTPVVAKPSTPVATPERTTATPMKAPANIDMPSVPTAKVSAAPMVSAQSSSATAPAAASGNAGLAQSLLAQGDAAAKAGKADIAVELFQKALEADAVYGQGKSIDRGAVYDRIGAVLAGG